MKIIKLFIAITFISSLFAACNKEDLVDYSNKPTEVILEKDEIYATPGQSIVINAQLVDDFGIKYVSLFSGGLLLDDQVGISSEEEIFASYNFTYTYELPVNLVGTEYEIQMKVKNLTGQLTENVIKVIIN